MLQERTFALSIARGRAPPIGLAAFLSRRREYRYPWARRLFRLVSPVFTFSFILVRTFISIPLVAWYSKRLLFDSPAIPLAYRMGMQALVTAGLGGSQVWSWRLYRGWVRSRATEKKGE
jgi:hypothetical protein